MAKVAAPTTDDAFDEKENLPATTDVDEDSPELDPDWDHDRITFANDDLAVRAPTSQALAGFSLASSKYVDASIRNDMTGLFIVEHLGPDSYGRVMRRLMDGDDPDYDADTIGVLMREIVMLTTRAVTDDE